MSTRETYWDRRQGNLRGGRSEDRGRHSIIGVATRLPKRSLGLYRLTERLRFSFGVVHEPNVCMHGPSHLAAAPILVADTTDI